MKVLLLQNVRKVGQKGNIVEVSEGYGRNFLIKNLLAREATSGVIKEKENSEKNNIKKQEIASTQNYEIIKKVNKQKFEIKVNASKKGHLFAAIRKKEISKETGIPEKNIILEKDIKEVGEYDIKLKFDSKKAKIFLTISS